MASTMSTFLAPSAIRVAGAAQSRRRGAVARRHAAPIRATVNPVRFNLYH
jgi:hypothetical protein